MSVTDGLLLTECAVPYINADPGARPLRRFADPADDGALQGTGNTFGGGAGASYNITGRGATVAAWTSAARSIWRRASTSSTAGRSAINSTATVNGDGVTFYLVNGAHLVDERRGLRSRCSAPNAGNYAGVLVYVDRNEPFNDYTVNGNLGSTVNGAIYAANGHVRDERRAAPHGGGCTPIWSPAPSSSAAIPASALIAPALACATSARPAWSRSLE